MTSRPEHEPFRIPLEPIRLYRFRPFRRIRELEITLESFAQVMQSILDENTEHLNESFVTHARAIEQLQDVLGLVDAPPQHLALVGNEEPGI